MSDLADLNLRLSYWFLNHRDQLKKWWVMLLIVIDVFLIVFWVIGGVLASSEGRTANRLLVSRALTALLQAPARSELAQPLVVGAGQALATEKDRVTLVAELKNPNAQYAVEEVRYQFRYGGEATPVRSTFLLPDSRRYVFESSVRVAAGATPALEIVSVAWRRPPDPQLTKQLSFEVSDVQLDLSAHTTTLPPRPAPHVFAKMRNSSVYTFRRAEVSVALVAAEQPVAAGLVSLRDWQTFSDQTFDFQWLGAVPSNAQAVIVPQVNLLDEKNFLQP